MMKSDIGMLILQLPLFSVQLHGGMAVATGKHALCHRRGGDRELFMNPRSHGSETSPEEDERDNHISQFPLIWVTTAGHWKFKFLIWHMEQLFQGKTSLRRQFSALES